MNWYLAKIVFSITCGNGTHRPQFDEQLRLMEAPDVQDALRKARQIGVSAQEAFTNDRGQVVRWQLVEVAELVELGPRLDGLEVYSAVVEPEEAGTYLELLRTKARRLPGQLHCPAK